MPCFLLEKKNNHQTFKAVNPASDCIIPCLARHPHQLEIGTSIVVIINYFLIGFEVCSTSWSPYLAPLSRLRTCDYTGHRARGDPTSVIPLRRNSIKQIPNDLLKCPYINPQPSSEKFTCRRWQLTQWFTAGHSAENKRLQNVQL